MRNARGIPSPRMQQRSLLTGTMIALLAIAAVVIAGGLWLSGTYNALVRADQDVRAQWAQVENAYQRRADLVPNLVQTVKGAAQFERQTFTEVANARAQVGQVSAQGLQK